jgi:hypothetical protein
MNSTRSFWIHRLLIISLFLNTIYSCDKIAKETDPSKIILGKWVVIQMGNWPVMEDVPNAGGYDEYLNDSIKIEYAYNPPESYPKNYWIDSLLHVRVYSQEEQRYVLHFRFKYEFFDKNQKMRLDFASGVAEYKTGIYKRIK